MGGEGGVVLAMGTFDGVHRGHQAVIGKAVSRAKALGIPSMVMSFRSPPRLFFSPSPHPSLITTPEEKLVLFKSLGVDRVALLPFGKAMARLSAEDFFDRWVRGRWKAREIVVGRDFAFGRERGGNADFLRRRGEGAGIRVHVVPPVLWRGRPVSSGTIREHLREGDLRSANAKLGRPHFMTGRVVRGDGRGNTLGYPTANFRAPKDKILPPGVFAVRVEWGERLSHGGMTNVGRRPTLGPGGALSVETHIFDYSGPLAGKDLKVSFIKKIREERRFSSLEALRRRLLLDARAARAAL